MVDRELPGEVGVSGCDGVADERVLVPRSEHTLLDPLGVDPPHDARHLAEHRREQPVLGHRGEVLVEAGVEVRQPRQRAGVAGFLALGHDRPQLVHGLVGALGGSELGHEPFERGADLEDLGGTAAVDRGDTRAAPRFEGDEPFGGEHLEGLADRVARDAELARDRLLVEPAAGRVGAVDDAVADGIGHRVPKWGVHLAERGSGVCGHVVESFTSSAFCEHLVADR